MSSDYDEAMDVEMESTNNQPSTSTAETSDLNEPSTSKQNHKSKDKLTRYGRMSLPLVLESVGCEPNKYAEVSQKMKKRCSDEMELLSKSLKQKINFLKQKMYLFQL